VGAPIVRTGAGAGEVQALYETALCTPVHFGNRVQLSAAADVCDTATDWAYEFEVAHDVPQRLGGR